MADDFGLFDFDKIQADHGPNKELKNDVAITQGKQVSVSETDEDGGGLDPFCYDLWHGIQRANESGGVEPYCYELGSGSHKANMEDTGVHFFKDHRETILDCWTQKGLPQEINVNEMYNYEAATSGKLPSLDPEIGQLTKHEPYPISTTFFELLRKHRGGRKTSGVEYTSTVKSEVAVNRQKLSTEEIMRIAGERYIQFSTNKLEEVTTFIHPYGSALSSLSKEEARDADLAHLLLTAAEKVGYRQYDAASRLLTRCESMASEIGNPTERIAVYFAEALRERIRRETESITMKTVSEKEWGPNGLSSGVDGAVLVLHQAVPFTKVVQFASMQTIIDHVAEEKKIHLIDLHIRTGIQWTPLIQTLSERTTNRVELLKITAIDTKDKHKVEEIGKILQSFASSLCLPLSFKLVFVSDMKDLSEELFDINSGEAVVVYAPVILRTMISKPHTLETLMRVIIRLRPLLMVLYEVEASQNSPSFVNRFIEALFFYSAWFDCLEDCLDRNNQYRLNLESFHFGKGIQNTIATEGEERSMRSVKINIWRDYFARFKMVEVEVRKSSFCQAEMVLKKEFSCGSSCKISNNGKCLIVEWKGTPIFSLSIWKFS